ncbi:MAG: glycosyltransferase family 39 protein [Chloroflexi bacterium]|nr:glycosyltransferase family 39 protein [Chloroflexota bacterium]
MPEQADRMPSQGAGPTPAHDGPWELAPLPASTTSTTQPLAPGQTSSSEPQAEAAPPFAPKPGGLRGFLRWFKASENIAACVIALAILVVHILLINTPPAQLSTPEWMRQDALNKKDSSNPAPSPQYIFDELHYVPEAIRFLHREGDYDGVDRGILRPEHPPLGKWLIASGVFLFGDNPIGWRLLAALFGTASILVFYLICRRLATQDLGPAGAGSTGKRFWKKWAQGSIFIPLLATFLFATENLSFVQAQVAMLDVFYLTPMLIGILFYLRRNYLPAGVFMGLSMLGKAMAALPILGLAAHWAITRRREIWNEIKFTWNALRGRKGIPSEKSEILGIARYLIAIPVVWFALLTLLEYPVTYQWVNPIGRTLHMLSSHLSLIVGGSLPSGIASRPWSWVYFPGGLYYWYDPHLLGSIGWTVWAFIIASMAFLMYVLVRVHLRSSAKDLAVIPSQAPHKVYSDTVSAGASTSSPEAVILPDQAGAINEAIPPKRSWLARMGQKLVPTPDNHLVKFALAWFASVYVLLIVLELATDRLMYHFYFYPAVPPVALAIAYGAWRLWAATEKGRRWRVIFPILLGVYILATIATFVIMSPYGTKLVPLPTLVPNVP